MYWRNAKGHTAPVEYIRKSTTPASPGHCSWFQLLVAPVFLASSTLQQRAISYMVQFLTEYVSTLHTLENGKLALHNTCPLCSMTMTSVESNWVSVGCKPFVALIPLACCCMVYVKIPISQHSLSPSPELPFSNDWYFTWQAHGQIMDKICHPLSTKLEDLNGSKEWTCDIVGLDPSLD